MRGGRKAAPVTRSAGWRSRGGKRIRCGPWYQGRQILASTAVPNLRQTYSFGVGRIEDYLAASYKGRTQPADLTNDEIRSELHELIDAGPEVHGLISDDPSGQAEGQRRATNPEAIRLQRNLEALRRRADSLWKEFNHRFGQDR